MTALWFWADGGIRFDRHIGGWASSLVCDACGANFAWPSYAAIAVCPACKRRYSVPCSNIFPPSDFSIAAGYVRDEDAPFPRSSST